MLLIKFTRFSQDFERFRYMHSSLSLNDYAGSRSQVEGWGRLTSDRIPKRHDGKSKRRIMSGGSANINSFYISIPWFCGGKLSSYLTCQPQIALLVNKS